MKDSNISGIVNILKPPGMTSHDVVGFVRRTLHTKKVGHAGTLDPDAAGVLPVFIGDATKVLEYQEQADKTYRVHMQLGIQTDTGDDTGNIVFNAPISSFSDDELQNVLESFKGDGKQIPPMYSAIKIQGQKLYQLARKGIEVSRTARSIHIQEIKLVERYYDILHLETTVSKGTYVRTLIEDIAKELNNYATMKFLLRTSVGNFHISESVTLEDFAFAPTDYLLPLSFATSHLPKIEVTHNQALRICNGVATTVATLSDEMKSSDSVFCIYFQDILLGIGRIKNERVQPIKIVTKPPNNIVSD